MILAIIAISVLPAVVEIGRGYLASKRGRSGLVEATALESTDPPAEAGAL